MIVLMIGTALVCMALGYPVMRFLRYYEFWDQPNERSSHEGTVLRGGGLAPLCVQLAALGVWIVPTNPSIGWPWFCGLLVLGGISLLDDKIHVPAGWRLIIQIGVCGWVTFSFAGEQWSVVGVALATLLFVALINFVNFMDGINGLVAGQIALIAGGLGLFIADNETSIIVMAMVVSGSALGFLPHNFPKARVFLGDVGSITLGFSLGILLLLGGLEAGEMNGGFVSLLILPAYFFFEGVIAIGRRLIANEPIWTPHREHFYQRLIRAGWSHQQVAGVIWAIQIIVTITVFLGADRIAPAGMGLFCLLVWAVAFGYAEHTFNRHVHNSSSESAP